MPQGLKLSQLDTSLSFNVHCDQVIAKRASESRNRIAFSFGLNLGTTKGDINDDL